MRVRGVKVYACYARRAAEHAGRLQVVKAHVADDGGAAVAREIGTQRARLRNFIERPEPYRAPRQERLQLTARIDAWIAHRRNRPTDLTVGRRERARVNAPRKVREEYRAFAGRVVIALERRSMSQHKLAKLARVSKEQVFRYATARAMPAADVALRLADALGVELLWLVSARGPMQGRDEGDA